MRTDRQLAIQLMQEPNKYCVSKFSSAGQGTERDMGKINRTLWSVFYCPERIAAFASRACIDPLLRISSYHNSSAFLSPFIM